MECIVNCKHSARELNWCSEEERNQNYTHYMTQINSVRTVNSFHSGGLIEIPEIKFSTATFFLHWQSSGTRREKAERGVFIT